MIHYMHIISETINKYLNNIIKEYHDQPRLPFKEFGNGHAFVDEFIDWIQYSSVKGKLPKPTITWKQGLMQGCKEWVKKHPRYSAKDLFNDLYSYYFIGAEFDKNGNIYVERKISFKVHDLLKSHNPYFFEDQIFKYEDNVGGCWSWMYGESNAYCGDEDDNCVVTLKGYMFLDDIYWEELIRLTCFNEFGIQYEIRTYPRGRVMLTNIDIYKKGEEYIELSAKDFDGPRILRQTYLGDNKSFFTRNYAPIGFKEVSYDKHYIDRKGNEYTEDEALTKEDNYIYNSQLNNGYYRVYRKINGVKKYNLIDTNKKIIFTQWLDKFNDYKDGFAVICINDKGYNYIDEYGNLLYKNKLWFEDALDFKEGFGLVFLGKDKGMNIIDTHGNILLNKLSIVVPAHGQQLFRILDISTYQWYLMDKNGNITTED